MVLARNSIPEMPDFTSRPFVSAKQHFRRKTSLLENCHPDFLGSAWEHFALNADTILAVAF